MCGFAGIYSVNQNSVNSEILSKMSQKLVHRGPDDSGLWIDDSGSVGLAHQRLAVVDLTSAGHQPMQSSSNRFTIVFNGEIYNHQELRKQLDCFDWSGQSDTETLLACIELWGLDEALDKINGMFSFSLWDDERKTIYLVRDRMGEKPLYYGWQGDCFLFGSELKSLKVHPNFQANIDKESLDLYFRYNYIPSPYSIYRGISKLPAGSLLSLHQGEINIRKYWSVSDVVANGLSDPLLDSAEDLAYKLDILIKKSIKQKMESDVPLGAF